MMQKCTVTLEILTMLIVYRINTFVDWTEKWQVKLNTEKYKIISIHYRRYSNTDVEPHYVMNNISLEEVVEIKD